jgi:hypothetical protein
MIIDSLTIFVSEMPGAFNDLFHSILPYISKIATFQAGQDLIISVLGFLHNLSMHADPKLLHEVIYSVFDFVLIYTDTEKVCLCT